MGHQQSERIHHVGTKDIPYSAFTTDEIVLNLFYGTLDEADATNLEVSNYAVNSKVHPNDENVMYFESVDKAYEWLIEEFIDAFGDDADMNKNHPGQIIYDVPVLSVQSLILERRLLAEGKIPPL